MRDRLKITGVCGWGIPPEWLKDQISHYFPRAEISAIYPENPGDPEEAANLTQKYPAQFWIGYSLGSLWLMKYGNLLPQKVTQVFLCPIIGFTQEMGRAGKTRRVQLNYLIKQLSKVADYREIVFQFFEEIDLSLNLPTENFPIKTQALINGLGFLRDTQIDPVFGPRKHFLIGAEDPLIDSNKLSEEIRDLIIVPNTGHHPAPLLNKLSEIVLT